MSAKHKMPDNQTSVVDHEIIQDDSFNYEGYEVVRGEFFVHTHEPAITFNNQSISVNMACLKRLPDVEYVQMLVNQKEQKLAVRPSRGDEKDAFIWHTHGEEKKPKHITCRIFFAKVMDLMDWNPDYRHKLLGKLVCGNGKSLLVFDLTAPNIYRRISKKDGKTESARTPTFPREWRTQFGLPVEEHSKRPHIRKFEGYTVFSIKDTHDHEPLADSANSSSDKEELS